MKIKERNLSRWCCGVLMAFCFSLIIGGSTIRAKEKIEPIELRVFISEPGQPPTPDNKIMKMVKEEFGVSLKYEFLVGEREQKLGVMIAGGDYPDLIGVQGDVKLINAGAFIPLENLVKKYAPNLKKHYAPVWNQIRDSKDGHIYVFPNYGLDNGKYNITEFYSGGVFWMQKAILTEFGYPKVKTLDQYFDLIKRYKEKHPTIDGRSTIGFEICCDGWRDFCLTSAPQQLSGHPEDGGAVVNPKTLKATWYGDKDYAKQYFKKLNAMNKLDLIDRETFVANYDQYMAKLSSGRVLGMYDQRWNFDNAVLTLNKENKVERTWAPCPVVLDPKTREHYMCRRVLNLNNGFGITTKCKDPVRVIKFFDALLTEKWQKMLLWGIPGVDYKVDSKGRFYRTSQQRTNGSDPKWILANQAYTLSYFTPKMEGTFKDGNSCSPSYQPEEFFATLTPYDQKFLTTYGHKTWAGFYNSPGPNYPGYPTYSINLIDGSPAKIAATKTHDISKKYLPMAILADPKDFNKIWAEYVTELHKCNIKAIEDRYNEQLQLRVKNWGQK